MDIRCPPEELQELGCTAKEYKEGIRWLKKFEKETIEWEEYYFTTATLTGVGPSGIRNPVYGKTGKSIRPKVKRQLTREEVKRLLLEIERLHLIVETSSHGVIQGVVYQLYANPQADRLAEGLPARGSLQNVKPLPVCFLHWESFKEFFQKESEPLLVDIFKKMKPFSHSKRNRAWLAYWDLKVPPELSSCTY